MHVIGVWDSYASNVIISNLADTRNPEIQRFCTHTYLIINAKINSGS